MTTKLKKKTPMKFLKSKHSHEEDSVFEMLTMTYLNNDT